MSAKPEQLKASTPHTHRHQLLDGQICFQGSLFKRTCLINVETAQQHHWTAIGTDSLQLRSKACLPPFTDSNAARNANYSCHNHWMGLQIDRQMSALLHAASHFSRKATVTSEIAQHTLVDVAKESGKGASQQELNRAFQPDLHFAMAAHVPPAFSDRIKRNRLNIHVSSGWERPSHLHR
eukprot:665370-Amphidinium_carterae.1